MNQVERQERRRMLEGKRDELLCEVREKRKSIRSVGTDGEIRRTGNLVDDANVVVELDMELALLMMKLKILNVYNQALVQLERNLYGNCSDCGKTIPFQRLEVLPFATRCKDCEESREVVALAKEKSAKNRPFNLPVYFDQS